jgi:hypothetical protein
MRDIPVKGIDCRTLTCRVVIDDDGSGAVSERLPLLAMRMAGTFATLKVQTIDRQGDGRSTRVLFLSREKST